MLSHIATDLQQVYLEEVFTPQLGKPGASTPAKPKSSSDLDGDGDVDSFEKKVRQIIYDVRHIMKERKVTAEKAFEMRSSKTNYSAEVIKTAKEKLGIIGGSATSVAEEILSEDDKVGIVVNYKNGTTYRKSVSRDSVQTELQKFRSNPNVASVERTGYGLAKRDYDGDSKIESPSKEHAGAVHNAIQRKTGGVPDGQDTRGKTSKKKLKSYGVSEGFSNWRDDLCEVAADEIKSKKKSEIKENPAINNKVVINPEFKEEVQILGGHIVESFELNEEYLNEAVDIATEFFYNCGLNENGVDIVINELGEEKFTEFVFDLSEEYFLIEARSAKKRTSAKSYEEIKAEIDAKESARKKVTADKTKKAVDTAKQTQAPSSEPRKKSVKDRVAGFILRGIERDRAARQTASKLVGQTGQTLKKAASVGSKAATEFSKGVKSGVETTADVAKKTKKAVVGEEYIEEKSESEQQQKLFGLALSVKRGETPRSDASAEVLKIVDTMSEKKIRDFAKTPHSEVPKKKVNEAIARVRPGRRTDTESRQRETKKIQTDNAREKIGEDFETQTLSPQELNLRKQKASLEQRLSNIRQRTVRQQKPQEKPVAQQTQNTELQNQSYEPEGDVIDERRREEKGTPRKPRDPAFEFVAKLMGSNRLGVKPRGGKKVPGQKPPVAGEYGAPESPAQKLAKRKTEPTKVGSRLD
jgi:hypothetical protein